MQPRTRFSDFHRRERNLGILQRVDAGETMADIADDLGISPSRILQIVNDLRRLRASPRSWANYLSAANVRQ